MSATSGARGPAPWRRLLDGWLLIAARFGEIQTLLLVTLVYGLVIGPAALGVTAARRDLLHKRRLREPGSAWTDADSVARPDLERARRPF